MFGIGTGELIVVGIIALLLFGKRLPEVARSVGKGISEFKQGLAGMEDDVQRSASHQTRSLPSEIRETPAAPRFEPPRFEPTEVAHQG